ncbi:hypothetical protein HNQ69_000061 [Bartonella callosciuri]|uniref:SPOR domain-containing protein n=1 Tax=Bartonella callosciuri TaxID=686223 RepID=A0A840NXY6_9HYPH|nr:SPOR domain-containing protein [Bartonella callosciuri]MBB5072957.1 hypothetical protein [Bartonella callosciuri]
MSGNDRKNLHEMKRDHEHHDPLERLTQLFNPNKQSVSQQDQSSLQTDQSRSRPPKTSSHDDDLDLSFLEAELENNLTNNLPFDDQKKPWDSHTTSSEQTSYVAQYSPSNQFKENNFLSKNPDSSSLAHDEEQILDALSPLPIQKNQSPQYRATSTNADLFFKKSDFSAQSENFFFDEADRDNNKDTTVFIEHANHFPNTNEQQSNTPDVQQNYEETQNLYDAPINHSYKASADQENLSEEFYTDISPVDENMFFPSSNFVSERKNTVKNETRNDFSSYLDPEKINNPSDLKGFPQKDHTTDYPEFYGESLLEKETYTEEALTYRNAQSQYISNAENISSQTNKKEVLYSQNNLNDTHHASETLNITETSNVSAHNYTHRDDPPPNVDTYKFSEEIVEKTGQIMVPKVPYEAPEYDVPIDDLKEEFADVLNVGNVSAEDFSQQQRQSQVVNEIFHQTIQNQKEDAYTNSQNRNAKYFSADNVDYNSSSFTEKSSYRGVEEVSTPVSPPSTFKNFIIGKSIIKGAVFLILMAIGFVGYSHFFMPSQQNESTPIIQADNTPFKFKQEITETKNDIAHNLDIYKQKTGQNEKQENPQQFLIDKSEQPEDLAELNQQESTNFSSSSLDESDVENAVTEAINHTIPTREIQTVVVNQDGTIALSPKHQTEGKTSDELEKTIDKTPGDQFQDSSSISSNEADINTNVTEDNITSEIDKIIAENASISDIEKKVIPIPPYVEDNSEVQTHDSSRPALPSKTVAQHSENYYVQLASQPTQALARDSLKRMKSRFGFLIGSRPLNIQSALIPGKGTYYRIRIQTQNRNDAINLCEDIKNSGGNCFITR